MIYKIDGYDLKPNQAGIIACQMYRGTRDPVAFKDTELGLVRLRAFGIFNLRIVQPVLFVNRLVGTQGVYTTEEISEYLNQVVVSRFNDYIGEKISTIFDLPAQYDELAKGLSKRIQEDFSRFGLAMTQLFINAITPPPEVQQAIDDKSRMEVFDDMNKLMQMKTAMAMFWPKIPLKFPVFRTCCLRMVLSP